MRPRVAVEAYFSGQGQARQMVSTPVPGHMSITSSSECLPGNHTIHSCNIESVNCELSLKSYQLEFQGRCNPRVPSLSK